MGDTLDGMGDTVDIESDTDIEGESGPTFVEFNLGESQDVDEIEKELEEIKRNETDGENEENEEKEENKENKEKKEKKGTAGISEKHENEINTLSDVKQQQKQETEAQRHDNEIESSEIEGEQKYNLDQGQMSDRVVKHNEDSPLSKLDTSSDNTPKPNIKSPLSAESLNDSHLPMIPPKNVTPENSDSDSEYEYESDDSFDGEWQEMNIVSNHYDVYDDHGDLLNGTADTNFGKGAKDKKRAPSQGYTRISIQSQAESYALTDKQTDFLFQAHDLKPIDEEYASSEEDNDDHYVDDNTRSALDQMQATKSMLKEEEIFAYVGLVKLLMIEMATDLAKINANSYKNSKVVSSSQASLAVWSQKVMANLFEHMDVSKEEKKMVDNLSYHGIEVEDLSRSLAKVEEVDNPIFDSEEAKIVSIDIDTKEETLKDGHSDSNDKDIDGIVIREEEEGGKEEEEGAKEKKEEKKEKKEEKKDTEEEEEDHDETTMETDLEKTVELNSPEQEKEFGNRKLDSTTDNEINDHPNSHEIGVGYNTESKEELSDTASILNKKRIKIDVSWTVICDLFLILIYESVYDSRSRTLLMKFGQALNITNFEICQFERRITEALEIDEGTEQTLDESEILRYRAKKAKRKRMIAIGLAGVGGSLILGVSGGLLGPLIGAGIAAGLSTVGIAGTSGFLAGTAGTAIVTTVSTGIGAKVGISGMMKRTGQVKTFEFRPLHSNRRLNLIITVSGWMNSVVDDIRLPFSTVDPAIGDLYSLLWEPEMLTTVGQTINILATEILTQSVQQILGATVLTALMSAIQVPMALSKLGYLLDNPWNVSLDRAWAAGLILADTLISRNLGVRPITLVGFSIGSRLIYSCLLELAKKGAFDLVENVIIFGAPFVCKADQLALCRSVVSGRFINGYSKKDWILGYLFRATSGGIRRVVGLSEVEGIPGIENFDCTPYVTGHMEYRKAMPKLMKLLGWNVLSEEFVEIDEPDAEQTERQRELVLEFDKNAQEILQDKNSKFNKRGSKWTKWFKPKKKEWWEVYAEGQSQQPQPPREGDKESSTEASEIGSPVKVDPNAEYIFDVDELRKEIEEMKETGELQNMNAELQHQYQEGELDIKSQSSHLSGSVSDDKLDSPISR